MTDLVERPRGQCLTSFAVSYNAFRCIAGLNGRVSNQAPVERQLPWAFPFAAAMLPKEAA